MSDDALVKQPTMMPTRKVSRGFLAGMLSWAMLQGARWITLRYLGTDVPPEVVQIIDLGAGELGGMISTAVGGAVAYFTKEKLSTVQGAVVVEPKP